MGVFCICIYTRFFSGYFWYIRIYKLLHIFSFNLGSEMFAYLTGRTRRGTGHGSGEIMHL